MTRTNLTSEHWESRAAEALYNPNRLARLCGVSMRQLQRVFRLKFDQSPREWLDERRIVAAQDMLRKGNPIKCVALELGYKQASHFCRQFKLRKQVKPSQFVALAIAYDGCRLQITEVVRG